MTTPAQPSSRTAEASLTHGKPEGTENDTNGEPADQPAKKQTEGSDKKEKAKRKVIQIDNFELRHFLEYAEKSAWFGPAFLLRVMWAYSSMDFGVDEDDEEYEGLMGKLKFFRDGLVAAIQVWLDLPWRAMTYMALDVGILLGAAILQPLLTAFFAWGLLANLVDVDREVPSVFCPVNYTYQNNTIPPASSAENCFFFALLGIYLLHMLAEIQNTVEFYLNAKFDERMDKEEKKKLKQAAKVEAKKERPDEDKKSIKGVVVDLPPSIVLQQAILIFTNRFQWMMVLDQMIHICSVCLLTSLSMLAMFFQKDVAQMVLNGTAVFFLETIDDEFKKSLIRRLSYQIDEVTKEYLDCTSREELRNWLKTPKRIRFTIAVSVLLCLGVIGLNLFLAVQTGRLCKPSQDAIKLFD